MKTTITIILTMLSFAGIAQTSNYRFVREGGQISYISSNDTDFTEHQVADDMVLPAKVAIGFPFKFNGEWYDSVGISENGFIWFGEAQAAALTTVYNPITSTLPAGVKGVVCAFGIDLHPHASTNLTTTIRSKIQHWAGRPNDFIVEWRNTSRQAAVADIAGEDTIGFQIQLYAFEDDRVQISYAYDIGINPNISSNLSVGMKGAHDSDYAIRMTSGGHPWDNTLAGPQLTSTCFFDVTSNPSKAAHNYMSWLSTTTGTSKVEVESSIHIFPVPAADKLFIETSETLLQYEIMNMQGQSLSRVSPDSNEINISQLPAGVYLLKLSTREGVQLKRFLKS